MLFGCHKCAGILPEHFRTNAGAEQGWPLNDGPANGRLSGVTDTPPIVLAIGGHDPTGGAGLQADIETVVALGGRAVTLVTQLTAQDTSDVHGIWANSTEAFSHQAATLLADIAPAAVKVGLTGSVTLIDAVAGLLDRIAGPLVLDPVLAAGGGFDFGGDAVAAALLERLVPRATLVTPNRAEACRLTGRPIPADAALALLDAGAAAVLLTGADDAAASGDDDVRNLLFTAADAPRAFAWPRLPDTYHGSGCTLAAACTARLAAGDTLAMAVETAQAFTWRSLQRAIRPGRRQALPTRWS